LRALHGAPQGANADQAGERCRALKGPKDVGLCREGA
jgi:hypothetical protein